MRCPGTILGLYVSVVAALSVGVPAVGAPSLVLVELGEDDEQRGWEQTLAEELALVLDDVQITRLPPPGEQFGAAAITDQVEALRDTVMAPGILAAGWLDCGGESAWRLVLVFAGEGRAVVQLVESPPGPDGLAGLALAAREVLAASLPVVRGDPPSVPPAEEPVAPAREPRWGVAVGGCVGWGVVNAVLPAPAAGGHVGGGLRLVDELWLELGVVITGAAEPATDTSSLTVGPRLQVAWLPGSEGVGVGPLLGFQVAYVRAFGGGQESALRDDSATRPTVEPGLAARVRLAPQLEIVPSFRAAIGPELPLTKGRTQVDEAPATAALDLVFEVGVRIRL